MEQLEIEQSTQERLLQTATRLFALKGFDGATTRMIVQEASANLSAIPFHFTTKENLYQKTLERALNIYKEKYQPIYDEIDTAEQQGLLDENACWDYIVELIGSMVEGSIGNKNCYETMLINRELLFPTNKINPFLQYILNSFQYFEKLFLYYTGTKETLWAKNYSYLIMSTLFTYPNYPTFMPKVLKQNMEEVATVKQVKMYLKRDLLTSIKVVLQSRKNH